MSVNRDMKSAVWVKVIPSQTASGFAKPTEGERTGITMAIYQKEDRMATGNLRYPEATHAGLTRCRGIKKDDVILSCEKKYQVTASNPEGRMSSVTLKEVEHGRQPGLGEQYRQRDSGDHPPDDTEGR